MSRNGWLSGMEKMRWSENRTRPGREEAHIVKLPIFYLVNCYTPNSKDGLIRLDYRMQWEDDFRAFLKKLEEYFRGGRNSYKPLSQQTNKLIDELKKNNSKHSKILYELKMEFYNYYSQICHNKLSTLTTSMKNYKPQQRLEELQSLFKNCFLLYQIIFDTLYGRFKIPRQAKFFSLLIETANYLGLNFPNINLLYRD